MAYIYVRTCAFLKVAALILAFSLESNAEENPVRTVAFLGDSLVHGFGLNPEDGLVPVLQEWLDANGSRARLLNAGVSGDTTAGGLARIDWSLTQDVDALAVNLGANDLLRGIWPELTRSNLRGILEAADERGLPVLLIGLEAPSNFGQEFKTEFESIFPDLAAEFGAILYPRFFDALERELSRDDARLKYMQSDGLHPNADGVELIANSLGPYMLELVARIE
ncbi:MAG: arylesterase [Albidovulum sp.]|nr:arylesterase [Albidovulum sp.]MDE0530300.1 arylesterase [Albidovulum sp.]